MRVLVDTSVWIDFFNLRPSAEAQLLQRLIEDEIELVTCGVVMAEFLQGVRPQENLSELESHFRLMTHLVPREPDSYIAAAALYRSLRGSGFTIRSTIDCLIAVMASESDVLLLHKDRDLGIILSSGLCGAKGLPAA